MTVETFVGILRNAGFDPRCGLEVEIEPIQSSDTRLVNITGTDPDGSFRFLLAGYLPDPETEDMGAGFLRLHAPEYPRQPLFAVEDGAQRWELITALLELTGGAEIGGCTPTR